VGKTAEAQNKIILCFTETTKIKIWPFRWLMHSLLLKSSATVKDVSACSDCGAVARLQENHKPSGESDW
jgi:hypothetical protein